MMDVSRRVLVANGQETQLTPKLAVLVEMFLKHPGETLDRKTLMVQVWDTDYLGDTRTLDVHVRWIRQAIEPDPGKPRYLKTIRGVGYRLDIPDLFEPDLIDENIRSLETV
jgi:DNA-binding response OmpR family regulator